MAPGRLFIGTAGWSIPRVCADRLAGDGTHLQRYARALNGVEINSSFHRPHAAGTYARWAASTPDGFRFAVKVPREITHTRKLVDVGPALDRFLDECAGLGDKRGPLLVQLPPSFGFDRTLVERFFTLLRERYAGAVACEPRHPTWLAPEVERLLVDLRVARVAADPPRMEHDASPGGWPGLRYFRWHGSPRIYWSSYDDARLDGLAASARSIGDAAEVWCVFDNTASGAAVGNALDLHARIRAG